MARNGKGQNILITIIILMCVAAGGFIGWLFYRSGSSSLSREATPSVEPDSDDAAVIVEAYSVYNPDSFDFGFIIAGFDIMKEDSGPSLDRFVSEEGIVLSDVGEYVSLLEEAGYYLGRKNVWLSLDGAKEGSICNVFIPFTDKAMTSLTVTSDINGQNDLVFDLTKVSGKMADLYYSETETVSGETYRISVSLPYGINAGDLYKDGVQTALSEGAFVYGITVSAEALNGAVITIEKARYTTRAGEVYEAEGSAVSSLEEANIIGADIDGMTEGALFFITYDASLDESGTLEVKLGGMDEWIAVKG